MKSLKLVSVLTALAMSALACSGGDDVSGPIDRGGAGAAGESSDGNGGAAGEPSLAPEPLEIIGVWVDDLGFEQIIDAMTWNAATIVEYDNAANTVYAQNAGDDDFNADKFTRTVYTEPEDDSFYFCTIVYDADTLDEARASTKVADPSAPESGGCETFPWSKASKP